MLRISFPFRLFEGGERNRTSSERETIADNSFVLGESEFKEKGRTKILL